MAKVKTIVLQTEDGKTIYTNGRRHFSTDANDPKCFTEVRSYPWDSGRAIEHYQSIVEARLGIANTRWVEGEEQEVDTLW